MSDLVRVAPVALLFTACTYVPSELELSSARDAGDASGATTFVERDGGGAPVVEDHNHEGHEHGEEALAEHQHAVVEPDLVAAGRGVRYLPIQEPLPALALEVVKDPVTGWVLEARLQDFELAPESSSTKHQDGQGHLHLYVDGELHAHVFGSFFFLEDLGVGEHRIRLELASNDHLPLASGEGVVGAARSIVQPDPDAPVRLHERHDEQVLEMTADAAPGVTLELHADDVVGHLIEIRTEGFELSPLNISNFHVPGEGHFRLSVDGTERERVFGHWHELPELDPGDHELKIELISNDHRLYTVEGEPISASLAWVVD